MWAALPAYKVEIGTEPLDRPARDSLGGWPFLDDDQEWPRCFCGDRMALFFQLDLPDDVEFFGGEHLSVFHCAHHNDASDPVTADDRLVPRFWEVPQPPFPGAFWRVLLQRDPGAGSGARTGRTRPAPVPAALRGHPGGAVQSAFQGGWYGVLGAVPRVLPVRVRRGDGFRLPDTGGLGVRRPPRGLRAPYGRRPVVALSRRGGREGDDRPRAPHAVVRGLACLSRGRS
ncbi:hypothetical protein GCM10027073_58020 [Streptomyces chlorus]